MMGAVAERMTWTGYETQIKAYCGVTGSSEDDNLQLWLAAATDAADRYMNNPFDGSSNLAPETLPTVVELGVYEYIKQARLVLGETGRPIGLMSVKTGDLSETYTTGVSAGTGGVAINTIEMFDALARASLGAWRSWIYKFNR
jgi:hypothetical protein